MRLHEIFDAVVRRHPHQVAIDIPPGVGRPARVTLTYAALDARVATLATAVAPLARPDDLVAVLLPRHAPDLYAAQLGVLRAGAAFTCLDPVFPDAHLRAVLADAGAAAVITDAAGRARLAAASGEGTGPVIDVGAAGVRGSPRAAGMPPRAGPTGPEIDDALAAPGADDTRLAYAIYTSGTTGQPKGVLIEHRSIANLVRSDVDLFGLGPGDRVAQVSSPAYDSSIEETWLALAAGATLVVLDDDAVRLGPDLPAWLRREEITVLCPPPTLLRAMACADPGAALPGVRLLYVGGEALPADLADLWAAGRWMENGYGPTECSVTVVRGRVRPGRPVVIGRPVRGNRAHVLDAGLVEVPDGDAGELCVAGAGLARGYHRRPDLTAAKFPAHPRLGRIYRTGDLVRRNADGDLEFLGRIDAQVKLRGYRVELEAIEAHLAAHPAVRAAACAVQGEGAGQVLAAHIVPAQPGAPPAADDLKAHVAQALPAYMVPSRFAWRDALPTTVGGKLDRRALPAIAPPGAAAGGAHTGSGAAASPDLPVGAVEAAIAGAFAAALGLPAGSVGRSADFFEDLGGDSLSAVAVVGSLRDGPATRGVAVRDLYEVRSAAALAARLGAAVDPPGARAVGTAPAAPARGMAVDPPGARAVETAAAATIPAGAGHAPPAPGTHAGAAIEAAAGMPARRAGEAHPAVTSRWPAGARPVLSTTVQTLWLAFGVAVGGGVAYATVLVAFPWLIAAVGLPAAVLLAPVIGAAARLAVLPLSVAAAVMAKRVLVGRYTAVRAPVWGGLYIRHWLVVQTARLIPWELVQGTALAGLVLRALGARVGDRVHIHRGVDLRGGGWDLLTIGDGATLGQDAAVRLVELVDRHVVVGPVSIGAGATLDVRAGLSPHTAVGLGAFVTALSWVRGGTRVPPGERWDGVPAAPAGRSPDAPSGAAVDRTGGEAGGGAPDGPASTLPAPSLAEDDLSPLVHALVLVAAQSARSVLGALPAALVVLAAAHAWSVSAADVLAWLEAPGVSPRWLAAGAALAAAALAIRLVTLGAGLRCLGRVRPGVYGARSRAAIRVWLKTGVVAEAGEWLSGSLFWPWWLRLAGMRIGRGSEISTIIDVVPETVAIGEMCFFADGIYFCGPRIHRGTVTVAATAIGRDTFVGNHAVVPAGHRWPDGLFVGVATVADAARATSGSAWFGHPPLALPRREVVDVDRRLTHEPDALRYGTRLFWEGLRFALPALPLAVSAGWVWAVAAAAASVGPLVRLGAVVPAATLAAAAVPCLAVVALKWVLLGRVRPGRHAFWSCWCGRWDFVYMAWDHWARETLARLEGTLLLNAFLRLTGMRIGRGVVLGDGFAQVVDPDMLAFEDGATVACQFQAHTFEDRVLKIDRLWIRRGATVGPDTVVFYGADVGPGAVVAPGGVVMKRERLPGGRWYMGCPVREVG